MKHMRKVFALALTLIMALALTVPAFAASITIDPKLPAGTESTGETYKAYKIFDATFQGDDTTGNVSYTIDSTSPFFSTIQNFKVTVGEGADAQEVPVFTLTQVNSTTTYIVTKSANYDAADLAAALKQVITSTTPVAGSDSTPDKTTGKYEITGLDKGYYIITSTLGSKMIIDTLGAVEIDTKNDYPTLSKKIVTADDDNNEVLVDSITADRGATITFKISVAIPETAVGAITVHDTLDDDMTYAAMTAVDGITKQNASEEADSDKCSFEFVLSANYVAENKGTTVAIYYTATLNADAETATAQPNSAYLTYAAYTSVTSTVNVYTYQVDVFKYTNGENDAKVGLAGAGFVLKNSAGKYYKETSGVVTWVDSVDDATEYFTTDAVGTQGEEGYVPAKYTVVFAGIANGTYTVIEKTVPTGYNPLAIDPTATINNANVTGSTQIEVLNQTGVELPSTGGIGTTIFYMVGGILMAGAAILLITKKKMSNEQ